jgi:hypothetical protein
MGFFSSLFNSNSKSKGAAQISNSMGEVDREDLACRLIRLRKKMDLISRGESESEAIKKSEVFLKELDRSIALSTPEGTVAVIIHTYMNSLLPALLGSKDLKKDHDFINNHIITEIENHRKIRYPGDDEFPLNIDDYVYYRLKVELLGEFDCTPEERGFDYITVKTLSHSAKGWFRK